MSSRSDDNNEMMPRPQPQPTYDPADFLRESGIEDASPELLLLLAELPRLAEQPSRPSAELVQLWRPRGRRKRRHHALVSGAAAIVLALTASGAAAAARHRPTSPIQPAPTSSSAGPRSGHPVRPGGSSAALHPSLTRTALPTSSSDRSGPDLGPTESDSPKPTGSDRSEPRETDSPEPSGSRHPEPDDSPSAPRSDGAEPSRPAPTPDRTSRPG